MRYQLSAVSYQLSAVSYQLSVVSPSLLTGGGYSVKTMIVLFPRQNA